MHYLGNKGSSCSGFYSPLSHSAWVYFFYGVALQASTADVAYLPGVMVTPTHLTHSAYSDSKTVKKVKIVAVCRTTAPYTL